MVSISIVDAGLGTVETSRSAGRSPGSFPARLASRICDSIERTASAASLTSAGTSVANAAIGANDPPMNRLAPAAIAAARRFPRAIDSQAVGRDQILGATRSAFRQSGQLMDDVRGMRSGDRARVRASASRALTMAAVAPRPLSIEAFADEARGGRHLMAAGHERPNQWDADRSRSAKQQKRS